MLSEMRDRVCEEIFERTPLSLWLSSQVTHRSSLQHPVTDAMHCTVYSLTTAHKRSTRTHARRTLHICASAQKRARGIFLILRIARALSVPVLQ